MQAQGQEGKNLQCRNIDAGQLREGAQNAQLFHGPLSVRNIHGTNGTLVRRKKPSATHTQLQHHLPTERAFTPQLSRRLFRIPPHLDPWTWSPKYYCQVQSRPEGPSTAPQRLPSSLDGPPEWALLKPCPPERARRRGPRQKREQLPPAASLFVTRFVIIIIAAATHACDLRSRAPHTTGGRRGVHGWCA